MDDTHLLVRPDSPVPGIDGKLLDDVAERAVHWLAERYVMSEGFARILLSQLARQDGVTETVAARSLLAIATIGAAR